MSKSKWSPLEQSFPEQVRFGRQIRSAPHFSKRNSCLCPEGQYIYSECPVHNLPNELTLGAKDPCSPDAGLGTDWEVNEYRVATGIEATSKTQRL